MKTRKILILILLFVLIPILITYQFFEIKNKSIIPLNFKVAFIGDQGLNDNSRNVLQLIKDEDTDMVLHQGDFDYQNDPDEWDQQINDILGPDFPYFASIGNHDVAAWDDYQQKLEVRLNKTDAKCVGNLGVKSACTYKGIFLIISGAGTKDLNHDSYIREQLAKDKSIWRICSWHKNQGLMQVGHKQDEVGWEPYEECRKGGAIIATGHEHSYSRTHLMDNFKTQNIDSTSNILHIEKGKTFAFVSGLGGYSIRVQNDELAANDWWATVYTSDQNASYGALFCIFNENGIKNKAHCYFKDIDGNIPDEFDIVSNVR
ncbi:MAG: metallophosphoesterase [Nanoarchaeota archaeon]|nr:metallophosphoesterase [Nanoarchaeota archaeon]